MKKTIILVLGLLIASPVFAGESDNEISDDEIMVEVGGENFASKFVNSLKALKNLPRTTIHFVSGGLLFKNDAGTPNDLTDDTTAKISKKKLKQLFVNKYTLGLALVTAIVLASDGGCEALDCPPMPLPGDHVYNWGVIWKWFLALGPTGYELLKENSPIVFEWLASKVGLNKAAEIVEEAAEIATEL